MNAGENSIDCGFLRFYRARGTLSSPLAINGGNYLTGLSGIGYDGEKYNAHSDAAIVLQAAQNFTRINHATEILFQTTEELWTNKKIIARITGRDLILGDVAQSSGQIPGGGTMIRGIYTGYQGANIWFGDSYGNGGGDVFQIVARRARGTVASPSGIQANDAIFAFSGRAYDGTEFTPAAKANFTFNASANWNHSSQPTYVSFGTTPVGSSTRRETLRINADGTITLKVSTPPSSSSASGDAGSITWDGDYIYVCIATNTWKRTSLSSW